MTGTRTTRRAQTRAAASRAQLVERAHTLLPDLSSPATTPTPTVRPSLRWPPSPSTTCQVRHLSPRTAASTGHPLPGPGPSPRARHVSATSKLNPLPTCPSAGVRGTGWDRCRFHVKPERRSTWARTCQRPHPPCATATRRSRREGENPLSSRRAHSPGRSSPSVKPPPHRPAPPVLMAYTRRCRTLPLPCALCGPCLWVLATSRTRSATYPSGDPTCAECEHIATSVFHVKQHRTRQPSARPASGNDKSRRTPWAFGGSYPCVR